MEQYDALLKLVEDSKKDFEAFYNKNNHAAGTRVRKAMQDVKNLAQDIRFVVQEIKNKE
jgi:uncharacterized membrane protein YukC